MPRPLKHPEMAELLVGYSMYLPFKDDAELASIRVAAHSYARRNGLVFETHANFETGEIEIARKEAAEKPRARFEVTPQRGRLGKQDLQALLDEAAAKL